MVEELGTVAGLWKFVVASVGSAWLTTLATLRYFLNREIKTYDETRKDHEVRLRLLEESVAKKMDLAAMEARLSTQHATLLDLMKSFLGRGGDR